MAERMAGCTRPWCLAGLAALLSVGTALSQPPAGTVTGTGADGGGSGTELPGQVRYVPLDAAAGFSQAVVVDRVPLVHTRQLWPLDAEGRLVGAGALDEQITQLLDNLEAVLADAGSSLQRLVRLNAYALSPDAVDRLRERLRERLGGEMRPALTAILTPMPYREALLAVDAVAAASAVPGESEDKVVWHRCESVFGVPGCADAATLPPGAVAYLSGVPAEGGLTHSAVERSLEGLLGLLAQLRLTPEDVVQLKVFLRPATAAEDVAAELRTLFGGQGLPPLVFVEWLAAAPVEMEMVVRAPSAIDSAARLEYYHPPDVRPATTFSRAVVVHGGRQIYVAGLVARAAGRGEEQAQEVFDQLQQVLGAAGSDLQQMAKATYYVSDDDAARGIDRVRPRFLHPQRPPAASKVMVHGMGVAERSLSIDMIAVPSPRDASAAGAGDGADRDE